MNTPDLISVIDIATESGRQKQTIFKVIKRLGINTLKKRAEEKHGQLISYVSVEDSKLLRSELNSIFDSDTQDQPNSDLGVFYLIQLEPELDPGRFKVGFASNINERLRSHRCSAPFAKVLKTWPCKSLWEKTAIDAVCSEAEQLHTEVFRVEALDQIKEKADRFFSLMPGDIEDK